MSIRTKFTIQRKIFMCQKELNYHLEVYRSHAVLESHIDFLEDVEDFTIAYKEL
jgi:hypothetical protein